MERQGQELRRDGTCVDARGTLIPGKPAFRCDRCGNPMLDVHCKLSCRRCGYVRDCSDP